MAAALEAEIRRLLSLLSGDDLASVRDQRSVAMFET